MDVKAVISAKGQVVIPKHVRERVGLHYGSELLIHMREDCVLEFRPVKKKLSDFFGMGARSVETDTVNIPVDVDEAIAEAVLENNPLNITK